jgi:hypothetical protein
LKDWRGEPGREITGELAGGIEGDERPEKQGSMVLCFLSEYDRVMRSNLKDEISPIWPRIPKNEQNQTFPEIHFAKRNFLKSKKSE